MIRTSCNSTDCQVGACSGMSRGFLRKESVVASSLPRIVGCDPKHFVILQAPHQQECPINPVCLTIIGTTYTNIKVAFSLSDSRSIA